MRLPESLLDRVSTLKEQRPQSNVLALLSEIFFEMRSQIFHGGAYHEGVIPRWMQMAQSSTAAFHWPVVVALLAEEGYQPYIEVLPLPADIPQSTYRAAKYVLDYLLRHPEAESAYQDLASRTVVGGAAEAVAVSLRDLVIMVAKGEMTRDEQHRELKNLFPFICSVWSLGRDVLKTAREGGSVKWRPIVFQGLP